MAFRTEKTIGCIAILLAGLPAAAQTAFRYEATHEHWRKSCAGTLKITPDSIAFDEAAPKKPPKKGKVPHNFEWRYADIQQLLLEPRKVTITTYDDVRLKLGADRQHTFVLPDEESLTGPYALLKDRLDQRFVAAIPDEGIKPLWQVAVKHDLKLKGSQGMLLVGADRIVYRTETPADSRTWRYADIENISSEGPFQLTLTTFERALTHYGSRKNFNFQLKEALPEARYNDLWRRLEQRRAELNSKGDK